MNRNYIQLSRGPFWWICIKLSCIKMLLARLIAGIACIGTRLQVLSRVRSKLNIFTKFHLPYSIVTNVVKAIIINTAQIFMDKNFANESRWWNWQFFFQTNTSWYLRERSEFVRVQGRFCKSSQFTLITNTVCTITLMSWIPKQLHYRKRIVYGGVACIGRTWICTSEHSCFRNPFSRCPGVVLNFLQGLSFKMWRGETPRHQ